MDRTHRPRRLRNSSLMRELVSETQARKDRLIMPHFITEGENVRSAIDSMPGIERVSLENLVRDVTEDFNLGLKYILLFGIPAEKDETASQAYDDNGIIQKAVRHLKKECPDVYVITDVCLCEYMSHGHCGIVQEGKIDNDASVELIAKTALSHAEAGADMVAPSDMMDGRIAAIRTSLDTNGYTGIPIMSYAAKYSSSFYGPFREAAGSTPQFGDRKTYQMDFRNAREAEKEVLLDIQEGADIVMVKPALAYLDIVKRIRDITNLPVCAYNVSGEYSMVKATAAAGYGNEDKLVMEILTALFRAGADMIISYHTRDIFRNKWL